MEENQIPEGWESKSLIQLADYINGFAFKPEHWSKEGLPIIRIEQLKNPDGEYDYCNFKIPEKNTISKGDLIFSWSASLFLRIWSKDAAALNQHLFKVLPFDGVDKFFLKYLLDGSIEELVKNAQGSTMQHITRKELHSFFAILPKTKTEQQSIANILSKTDQAIAKTEALIAKYTRIKTGLMQDLLTKGIDENGNKRSEQTHEFKDSPLGRIPQEWECLSIKDIAERLRSGVTPKGGSDVYENEGILLIRSQNVYSYGFKLDDVAYINEEINNRMLGSQLKEFDVLLNITGASIGRATYVPEDFPRANVNQHVCAIRLKKADVNNAIFLSSYLNSIYGQNQIYQNIAGSNREGINYTQIKEINVPFFNNDFELEKFSEMVIKSNERINSEMKKLSKLQYLKTGLMQDLLTGKVRVEI